MKKTCWLLFMVIMACACGSEKCRHECTYFGERMCWEDGFRECNDIDYDQCLEWNYSPCGEWEKCVDEGVCILACEDECDIEGFSKYCFDDTNYTCGYYDSDPCLELGSPVPCGPDADCKYGECYPLSAF